MLCTALVRAASTAQSSAHNVKRSPNPSPVLPYHLSVQIARVCGERDRALIFRGWSRLCLHAASLSAAEGASAAASASARAARSEAMKKEAEAAAASVEVAAAREEAQQKADRTLMLVAQSTRREQDVSWLSLRAKNMVNVFSRLGTEPWVGTRRSTQPRQNQLRRLLRGATPTRKTATNHGNALRSILR